MFQSIPFSFSTPRSFRHGFQGQEEDDEIKGEGNSVNFEYRMHDPRLGRFFAIDPLVHDYPELTPYQFSSNRLIDYREIEGMEGTPAAAFASGTANAFSSGLVFGYGRMNAKDYSANLELQAAYLRGQICGDILTAIVGGAEIDLGTGGMVFAGVAATNVEGGPVTETLALGFTVESLIALGHGTLTVSIAQDNIKAANIQLQAVNSQLEAKEEADKKKETQVNREVTTSAKDVNAGRNKAQELTGLKSGESKYYKGTTKHNEGKNVGLQSSDGKVRYRYDLDDKGFHINVEDFRKGKGANSQKTRIDLPGGKTAYDTKIKELNKP